MIRWIGRLSRDSRSHLLVAAVAVAWAVMSQLQASATDRRLAEWQDSQQAIGYGLWYALVEEQSKAGRYEAERNIARDRLSDLRYRIGVADARLAACRATTNMTTDDGWTGQLQLKTGRER
ncbi:hypothetical protein [Salinicola rhizosphaerae]|uniref:Uncharacterized protein n=1 Tax=Salinicola rhizosphaerae TaxID=1443141 RepID=A0ABQ3E9B9_9GAMM|nr:hypothetical protein [Salinicola rhizosphaerae]GHB30599.1 hypothetical protein GCM10009038_31740 [Salinicola rhizosphaerae]